MRNLFKHLKSGFIIIIFSIIAIGSLTQKISSGWVVGENNDAGWATILIADKISYPLAWDDVSSVVAKRFEIEMISKESGYIRTKWKYNWTDNGKEVKNYRVRLTIKMSEQRKKIEVNSEAEKMNGEVWIKGYDSRLLETIKKDIAGLVGA